MSENSKIEWTDHTFNPWEGCQKVGPGCDHCYAETRNARFAGGTAINWGPGALRRRTSPANWRRPLQWNKAHAEFFAQHGRRQRVFCASLADVFDNAVDPAWRRDLFDLIELTPNLIWLLLTKRIGNVFEMVARARSHDWLAGRDNVWLGATIVSQAEADRDIPKLLKVPARVRFLSMEPLLGPVQLDQFHPTREPVLPPLIEGVDWVIVGGESGHGARPINPAWARSLRDQCAAAGVRFLFKQWGEWMPADADDCDPGIGNRRLMWSDGVAYSEQDGQRAAALMAHVGKKAAGRLLDGRTHDQFPRGGV
ncbi:phage Gp37/Gp68 family protein [Paraburkholderia sp. LEh10]|uniref:phage Gp37/Gp68 family protein n=1 Tax=Paraburkholderia sp. LEh10 TaxID=2821353 RepID=UPI001AE9F895|nr:phage Gp37/Gp68 family protein [Paraburkholderia sp. LEh10]MBP0589317.1 phage Gp37/Gp68 family protein [Paraburkholderia sp. LEh10]